MFNQQQTKSSTITFSQWSRKGYAMFASLNKVVHIAHLTINIAQLSLLKSGTITTIISLLKENDLEENAEQLEELNEEQTLMLATMPIINTKNTPYSLNRLVNHHTRNPYSALSKVWVSCILTPLYS